MLVVVALAEEALEELALAEVEPEEEALGEVLAE